MNALTNYMLTQLAERRGLVFVRIRGLTIYVQRGDLAESQVQAAMLALSIDVNNGRVATFESIEIKLIDSPKS